MSLFQSNLRKQIRNLPKILNFVKKIHYYSKLFTSLLTSDRAQRCSGSAPLRPPGAPLPRHGRPAQKSSNRTSQINKFLMHGICSLRTNQRTLLFSYRARKEEAGTSMTRTSRSPRERSGVTASRPAFELPTEASVVLFRRDRAYRNQY